MTLLILSQYVTELGNTVGNTCNTGIIHVDNSGITGNIQLFQPLCMLLYSGVSTYMEVVWVLC